MAYTPDNFDYQAYMWSPTSGADVNSIGQGKSNAEVAQRAYQDYVSKGSSWVNAPAAATPDPTSHDAATTTQVTPGNASGGGQQNISDYTGQLTTNPGLGSNAADGTSLEAKLQDPAQTGQAAQISAQEKQDSTLTQPSPTVTPDKVNQPTDTAAHTYDAAQSQDNVAQNGQMTGAQGTINQNDLEKPAQIDTQAIANGTDAEGVGKALQAYASQNMSNVIDTSTASGKLAAASLGDGNYIDSKATIEGQLQQLQTQFTDPATGQPKIPTWAAGTARNVSAIMGFSGMTGTAATSAMSQALMEASLPIAADGAKFFQTLTIDNLNNKQQSVINNANTLAKFDQSNLDNRQAAAVQASQAFLGMDMKNLDDNQQAAAINNAAMVQSILADTNAKNVQRQFVSQSQDQTDQFYATLHGQIDQFNSAQTMTAEQYNATMADSREKYNATNSYNIAVSNANWRQAVQLQDDSQKFQAATTDVKTATDLQTDTLNKLWDRSDSMLQYAWQSGENDKTRQASVAMQQLINKQANKNATMTGIGQLAGTFVGSSTFSGMMSKAFGV